MKKVLLLGATLAVLGGTGSAMAADLDVATKAPMYVPEYSWGGFYFGVNAGYSFGRSATNLTDNTTTVSTPSGATTGVVLGAASGNANLNGALGGGQIGVNWQMNTVVLGLEADMQATGQKGSLTLCDTPACAAGAISTTEAYKLQWFGTFRGRVGMTVTPRWLLYLTGGLALGEFDSNDTAIPVGAVAGTPALALSINTGRLGWTFGGGAEVAFTDNWSFKVEYLYMDLGTVSQNFAGVTATAAPIVVPGFGTIPGFTSTTTVVPNSHITDNIIRAGVNYKF